MIASAVFAGAERQPEKIAVDYNGEAWSYRTFADAIATTRGHFHALGLEGDGVVVVAARHLRDWWVASLALRSLGLTTVCVEFVAEIGQLGMPDLRAVVVREAEDWSGLAETCAAGRVRLAPSAGDAAPLPYDPATPPGGHILLSSGTTGLRKKVLMDPSFEPAYLRRRLRSNGIDGDSVVSVIEFQPWTGAGYKYPAGTWFVGGTVVFSQGLTYDLALQRLDLTDCVLVPSMLATLLANLAIDFPRHDNMRLTVTGGTITLTQMDQAKARVSPRLLNGLAATESHPIGVTPLDTPEDHRWHRLCEGVIQVVDDDDQLLGPGHVGRLRIDTENGPQGYLNDEEATRAFFKNGFFYPGDLAVSREDGRIAVMGRVTDVINIEGQKVAPAPLEDALREALAVSGVCLITMQDAAGEEALHLVIETPVPIAAEVLNPVINRAISGFAVVRVHFFVALPRNAAGKVLRRELVAQVRAVLARQGSS